MARTLETLTMATRCVIDAEPWKMDARCLPIPWRSDIFSSVSEHPLTIAVLPDDGVVEPHPPVTRIMNNAIELLRSAGHAIITWNGDLHHECIEIMVNFPPKLNSIMSNVNRTYSTV